MTATAIQTGSKFRFEEGGEVCEFHSLEFPNGVCTVVYRQKANPKKLHRREVESLADLLRP